MKSVLVGIALSTTLSTPVLAEKVTPQEAVTALESKFGVFKGERRNHTKGLCFSASFTATNEAQKYTKSAIFTGQLYSIGTALKLCRIHFMQLFLMGERRFMRKYRKISKLAGKVHDEIFGS